MTRILVTTLAEYQTRFWVAVGDWLDALGHEIAFISFDDRSTEMIQKRGLKAYSATTGAAGPVLSPDELERTLEAFRVSHVNHWLSHERFAFGITDSLAQRRKLCAALIAADSACRDWSSGGPTMMVQELGGFLSVVGSYFAARRNSIDNWFIEPSFFRGRLFFLRNEFAALKVPDDHSGPIPGELVRYLDDTVRKGAIVIPLKDRHQYTTAWKKIVNLRNARRLAEKLVDKHVHGKKQEFGHIGSHVGTHARMLWSSYRLRGEYTPIDQVPHFVYYPLHVPGDMALTLRSPHLLDQLALIDLLCRSVPHTHLVAVKEHPAMVGAIDAARLRALLRRYDNLVLLPPTTNNYEVLARADVVVSINSKSGAEGALLGKPVLVLGDAFYRSSPLVTPLERLEDLPEAIDRLLAAGREAPGRAAIERYFAAVWARCLPGELYVTDENNVRGFSESLLKAVASTSR